MNLDELVHNSEQLSLKLQSIHPHGSFPSIKKNLNQIEQISKEILEKHPQTDLKTEISLLFSHNGIDLNKVEKSFENLNKSIDKDQHQAKGKDSNDQNPLLSPLSPISSPHSPSDLPKDNNFDSIKEWIDKKFEKEINQEFNQIIQQEADRVYSEFVTNTITDKFYQEQLKIFEDYSSKFLKLSHEKEGRLVLTEKIMEWLQIIKDLNEARLTNSSIALCQRFEHTFPSNSIMFDTWTVISRIIDENPEDDGQIFQIKKNLEKYRKAPKTSPLHTEWKKKIISGSRKASEIIFLRLVDRVLSQYPRDISLGGRPSTFERIKAYTTLFLKRMSESEMENLEIYNGIPIWTNLFFLIRAGAWKEAISFSEQYELIFDRSEPSFLIYLKSFYQAQDYILSGPIKSQIRASFAQKRNNPSSDPYKLAILKILGRCDLKKRTHEICSTIEDWIWLQLWLIRDGVALAEESRYTLLELQEHLVELEKENYFSNKVRYAQVLFMTGQFEQALYQLEDSDYEAEMIHMSIVLAYYGCLEIKSHTSGILFHYNDNQEKISGNADGNGSNSGSSDISKVDGASAAGRIIPTSSLFSILSTINVNYSRMMIFYSNELYKIDPIESFQYLFLISLADNDACKKAITDAIVKSGDYTNLLGEIQQDGKVSHGLLGKYSKLFADNEKNEDEIGKEKEKGIKEESCKNIKNENCKNDNLAFSNDRNEKGNNVNRWFCDLASRAALECVKIGRFDDSLMLYNLAREYEKVLVMLSERLSDYFTIPYDRNKIMGLQQTTNSIFSYYNSTLHISSTIIPANKSIWISIEKMLKLLDFRHLLQEARYFEAIGCFDDLSLIPLISQSQSDGTDGETVINIANSLSESLKVLSNDFLEIMGDAFLLYMESLQIAYRQLREHVFIDPGRKEKVEKLRIRAKSLMLMVGNSNFIRTRIGSSIVAKMAKIEVAMN